MPKKNTKPASRPVIFIGFDGFTLVVEKIPQMKPEVFKQWQVDQGVDDHSYLVLTELQARWLIVGLQDLLKK